MNKIIFFGTFNKSNIKLNNKKQFKKVLPQINQINLKNQIEVEAKFLMIIIYQIKSKMIVIKKIKILNSFKYNKTSI